MIVLGYRNRWVAAAIAMLTPVPLAYGLAGDAAAQTVPLASEAYPTYRVIFGFDVSSLSTDTRRQLVQAVAQLRRSRTVGLVIEGRAGGLPDGVPNPGSHYGVGLHQRRIQVLLAYLASQAGLAEGELAREIYSVGAPPERTIASFDGPRVIVTFGPGADW